METWKLIVSPPLTGAQNMELDLNMFHDYENGLIPSTLRIYSWGPKCISVGYAQKIEEEIDLKKAKVQGWDAVKRPTGGGIVFHNEVEITYALVTFKDNPVLPAGLVPSFKKISEAIIFALRSININAELRPADYQKKNKSPLCFSYPAEYEIVVDDKKIVGSAQKRGKKTLLQQGSFFMRREGPDVYALLKKEHAEIQAISVEEIIGKSLSIQELLGALIEGFNQVLGVKIRE